MKAHFDPVLSAGQGEAVRKKGPSMIFATRPLLAAALSATVVGCSSYGGDEPRSAAPITMGLRQAQPSAVQQSSPRFTRAASEAVAGRSHVVQPGENLYRIALQNGLTTEQLASINSIDAPYVIHPGQRLRLSPGTLSAPTPQISNAVASPRNSARPAPMRASYQAAPSPSPSTLDPRRPAFSWPVEGDVIARTRETTDGSAAPGWTIAVRPGSTVRAAAGGTVAYAGDGVPGFENLVLIRHDHNWVTAYGYNRRVLVSQGDVVERGDPIAEAGRRAQARGGQVYFEVRNGVTPIDPGEFLGG